MYHTSKTQRRDFLEEFNRNIQFIECVHTDIETSLSGISQKDSTEAQKHSIQERLNDGLLKIRSLLDNDYFRFMFTNNCAIKILILKFLQCLIQNTEDLNSNAFETLVELVECDFSLEKNLFRNEATKHIYGDYFSLLIPKLTISLYAINNKQRPSEVSLTPPTTPRIPQTSIFAKEITKNDLLFSLNELICMLFSAVPFEYLIYTKFFPENLDLLFDQLLSPIIYSKLMYTISNNICGYTHSHLTALENFSVSEALRIQIHDKCSQQTLLQMERNVRHESSRNLLKKALNNYCRFITDHKKKLESEANSQILENLDHVNSWQESLYKIVISIVKILRLEFENNTNSVEIDLVIYFYELLMINLDNLTSEDAHNIATKLMPVIIKINSWRVREAGGEKFSREQGENLYNLSFRLTDKFMLTLGREFCETEWENFEPIWITGIKDWYPMSYKLISTFCDNMSDPSLFRLAKKLVCIILDSWDENKVTTSNYHCDCGRLKKKRYIAFLSEESINAISDLAHFYDLMIQLDIKYYEDFKHDLMPLLDIFSNLLNGIKTKTKLVMFYNFYQKIFRVKSLIFKSETTWWKNHLVTVLLRLDRMCERANEIELDQEVYDSILECLKSVFMHFDKNYLLSYQTTINDTLMYISKNSRQSLSEHAVYNQLVEYF